MTKIELERLTIAFGAMMWKAGRSRARGEHASSISYAASAQEALLQILQGYKEPSGSKAIAQSILGGKNG